MTGALTRGEKEKERHMGRVICKDGGSNWGDVSTNQGMPRAASNHEKLKEQPGADVPSEPPEGTNLANTLILDFWPPLLGQNKFVI